MTKIIVGSTNEKAPKLYDGKFFYVVENGWEDEDGTPYTKLYGPYDNIYYASDNNPNKEYAFFQVVDGKPVQAFKHEEILVLDRKI